MTHYTRSRVGSKSQLPLDLPQRPKLKKHVKPTLRQNTPSPDQSLIEEPQQAIPVTNMEQNIAPSTDTQIPQTLSSP